MKRQWIKILAVIVLVLVLCQTNWLTDAFVIQSKAAGLTKISYRTHVQTYGWQDYVRNGTTSGTSGEAKRLEGINIKLENQEYSGNVEYRTHVQTYGWQNYVKNNEISGTMGKAKRLEAIQIKLTGEMANHYDIYYRVHAETYGWLGWAVNGEYAGTAGYGKRLEAIQIVLVSKGGTAPGKTTDCYRHPMVQYNVHCQTFGWLNNVSDAATSGTIGQRKRLEGIHISLCNQDYSGSIEYRTYIQTYGWESQWKKDGEMSGTNGKAKRLEAIQIKLTGDMAKYYDVYYRVHAQHFGWLGWVKNGESAGTAGYAYRLEAIQIQLVPKNGKAPTSSNEGFQCKHTWVPGNEKVKSGYACNYCYKDVTGWPDMYACHGAYHTHQWCLKPTSNTCLACGKKQHSHIWVWIKPDYYTGTDVVRRQGYYFCYMCFSFSKDGKTIDNSIQSSCDNWVTPYDFTGKGYSFVVESTESNEEDLSIDYININGTRSMSVGDTGQCSVKFTPANTTEDKTIYWTSSDSSVVKVDSKGKLTALKNGTAIITAETKGQDSDSIFIRVTSSNVGNVSSAKLLVNGVDITDESVKLDKNKEYEVTLKTNPTSAVYLVEYEIDTSEYCYISGSISSGNTSTYSWKNGIKYTDPRTNISTHKKEGNTKITAVITDINGNKTTIFGNINIQ